MSNVEPLSAAPDYEAEQEEPITVGIYRTRDNISYFRIKVKIRKVKMLWDDLCRR